MNEEQHLKETIELIQRNIMFYQDRRQVIYERVDELNDKITPRDRELNSQMSQQLTINAGMLEHISTQLKRNSKAQHKPYFGRIDYQNLKSGRTESWYIGKYGIFNAAKEKVEKDTEIEERSVNPEDDEDKEDVIVVDWRAPLAKVYYENGMGEGSYEVPEGDPVAIDLKLKRTFDIENGRLEGYYDSDVAANDELLVKYLAQHREVVLSDIIATIQKEQDAIIRRTPYQNIIVQGVAGSGKTTVALHRISHILYNYGHKYRPEDFCIIGSSDILLSYIVSGLPELDIEHVPQRRMDLFLKEQMEDEWKKNYQIVEASKEESFRCRMEFIQELDHYVQRIWYQRLKPAAVVDSELGTILTRGQVYDMLNLRRDWSMARLEKLLNNTLQGRIRMICDVPRDDPSYKKFLALSHRKVKEYENYFQPSSGWISCMETYQHFLADYADAHPDLCPQGAGSVISRLGKGRLDVYDMACLGVIRLYLTAMDPPASYGQIIIDEAQDFGEMIYFALKKMQPGCYFTIMGDVSQNIHYEMGMNDWKELRTHVFNQSNDAFYLLSKSYRNTIEISTFAAKVLEKAAGSQYKIDPVIRHGDPVLVETIREEGHGAKSYGESRQAQACEEIVRDAVKKGYRSAAVVCPDEKAASSVEAYFRENAPDLLSPSDKKKEAEDGGVDAGMKLMILPISLVKGLEFDVVTIMDADEAHYEDSPKSAKLLYVAITRALHELHVLTPGEVTPLLR